MDPQRQQTLWAIALENYQAAVSTAQQGCHNVSVACRSYAVFMVPKNILCWGESGMFSPEKRGVSMKKQSFDPEVTISCKVSPGMFTNERGVRIKLPDGREVSTLVDKRHVLLDKEPLPGSEVDGRVKVVVVETTPDSVLVDLPQPGFGEGPRLRVPKTFVREGGRDPQRS